MQNGLNTEGMLDMYLYENEQLLEQMEGITLEKKGESSFDEKTINEFFRVMHTIKGSSGMMMYENITEISHKLEDIFYFLREGKPEKVPHLELTDCILKTTDFIAGEFVKIKEGRDPDGNPESIIKSMDAFLTKIKKKVQKSGEELPEENVYVAPSQFYIAPVASSKSKFFYIDIRYQADTPMSNIRAYTAVYSLKECAEDLLYTPEDIVSNEASGDVILEKGFQMLLQAQTDRDTIFELIDHSSGVESITIDEISKEEYAIGFDSKDEPVIIDLELDIEKPAEKLSEELPEKKKEPEPGDYVIESREPGKAKKLAKNTGRGKQASQSFISVNVAKMDAMLDLIGEIVISEAVVLQNPDLQVPGLNLTNFKKAAGQLSKFTTEMQDLIMSMRMMPLTGIFQKMNRIVFDTSRKLEKDIELVTIGDNTEVDKSIIEHISDPIMHLIRNAVDHGIESAEERIACGKNPKGTVTLEAKNEGGKVFIIVRDDGKGLDAKKIFKKAKDNELVGNKVQSDFTEKEIFQFITYPGFSTNEQITEISGRGVGMDVVVKNIQGIGGRLEIESVEGKGSSFILKIPLTLAIINGIVMQAGNTTFVVETSAVKEFLSGRDAEILTEPDGEEYILARGECYPLIRINDRYHIENGKTDLTTGMIIILEHEDKDVCIFVDHLIGEQEIVVKPIPSYIKRVEGLSGCTQLGDGSIALIIDVGGLL